jgi:alkanesulfonate monooxygenase SsuD/methylene tetrahydromethanopterin reductase-like flavin-dependent oxidoreductase (luciferase family)
VCRLDDRLDDPWAQKLRRQEECALIRDGKRSGEAVVRIGISVASSYDVDDPRRGAQWMIERARAARDAGLASLFVGDHHVTPRPYYQNSPMLARMLAEWGDATAGALYLLPLWHPVLVAEQTATLASICRGRFVMQCALGGDERQSRGMGIDPRRRRPLFEEALAIIRALWRGEKVTRDGWWPVQQARISPLPPEPIEVWIGASAPAAIDRAARLGDAWLADPAMDPNAAGRALARYREACAKHGRSPGCVPIRRDVYVGASRAGARRTMAPYLARGHRGFPEASLLIGDVDEVSESVAMLGRLGYTDVIARNITADQSEALATIERLGQVQDNLR